ncbi:MAG: FlgD immunoglobulin-like domain containing protein [Candidatus Krumholzibacteriia bacterium]
MLITSWPDPSSHRPDIDNNLVNRSAAAPPAPAAADAGRSRPGVALIVAVLLAVAAPSLAQDCLEYAQWRQPLGDVALPSVPLDLAAAGDFVYAACGTDGLWIIDAANPLAPVVRGHLSGLGAVAGVDVAGGIAWVGAGAAGLRAVDCSDPASPVLLGTLALPGPAGQLVLRPPYAFVACGTAAVCVVDVADPRAPALLGGIGRAATRLALAGDRLYTLGCPFLYVFDVADPAHPTEIGVKGSDTCNGGLAAAGSLVYTGTGYIDDYYPFWPSFIAYDFADPAHAVPASPYQYLLYTPYDFAFAEGRLLVASEYLGVYRLDDALRPTAERRLGAAGPFFPTTLAVGDRCIFAGGEDARLVAFDRATLASPPRPGGAFPVLAAEGVACVGDLAYVATGSAGLQILDLSRPDQPLLRGAAPSAHPALRVAVADGLAVVLEGTYGLELFDVGDPDAPVALGALDTPGDARDVRLSGGHAFIADGPAGLTVVDVRDAALPVVVGRQALLADAVSLDLTGDLACLGLAWGHLAVVDVSDPAAPAPRGLFSEGSSRIYQQVVAVGPLVWVALQGAGLRSFDLSEPDHPAPLGAVELRGSGQSLAVSGHVGYLAGNVWLGESWVDVLDLSAPASPRLITRVDLPAGLEPTAAAVGGGRLLIAGGQLAQVWLDCADPTPVFLQEFTSGVVPGGVDLTWRTADGRGSPADFRLQARRDGMAWDVPIGLDRSGALTANDRSVLLAAGGSVRYELSWRDGSGDWSLLVAREVALGAPPPAPRLLQVRPNPANPRAEVLFTLDRPREVRLTVCDLAGRRVALLAAGPRGAGPQSVVWDGRDGAGRLVASGAYLIRLTWEGGGEARRVSLVR